MAERLWLMRHGEAAAGHPDWRRELTERGRGEVLLMSTWLAQALDHEERKHLRLVASPYVRAQQSARIVAETLDSDVETLDCITPDDSPLTVIDWLQTEAGGSPILLVSHMPLVGELTACLVGSAHGQGVGFATAGVAELEAGVWAAGCADLQAWQSPGALR